MVHLGPLGPIPYQSPRDIFRDAGIYLLVPPDPPLPPPPPKMPIPRTILGEDYVNVCPKCSSTLIWDIRLVNHNAPLRAAFVNWFRRVILRRPSVGCLGSYTYGKNCENYAGDKDE